MKVTSFFTNSPLRNYNHYFIDDNARNAYIFDPLKLDFILKSIPQTVENLYLLNTHSHHDHISKNKELLAIDHASKIELSDNKAHTISDTESIMALFTPGHHPNHYCFLLDDKDKQFLISGDNIFNCGIGNCKSSGANVEELYESITRLSKLDGNVIILPSHDYFLTNLKFALSVDTENKLLKEYYDKVSNEGAFFTTLKQEKEINPFFRLEQMKDLSGFEGMTSKEVFIKLRELRDNW